MSTANKIQLIQQMSDRGELLQNEARRILNLPDLPDGNRTIIRGEYYVQQYDGAGELTIEDDFTEDDDDDLIDDEGEEADSEDEEFEDDDELTDLQDEMEEELDALQDELKEILDRADDGEFDNDNSGTD